MAKEVKRPNKAKRVIISIGIAILFVMFVAYATETIYPSPRYENYCNQSKIAPIEYTNQTICEASNGTWIPQDIQCIKAPCVQGYCDLYQRCQQEFQNAQEPYNRNVFFISLIIGIIVLIISFIPSLEQISLGAMAGALLLIIYGTIRYWGVLSNIWKTIMIGFALAVLVWISYKKLKE